MTTTQRAETSKNSADNDRLLRLREVMERVGLRSTSIYRAIAEQRFPKPRRIYGRSVGWRASEIDEFIRTREYVDAEGV